MWEPSDVRREGSGSKPNAHCRKSSTAVQSTCLWTNCSWLWLHTIGSLAIQIYDMTPSKLSVSKSEILFGGVRYTWHCMMHGCLWSHCELFPLNDLWRQICMCWGTEYTFYWYIDCEEHLSLIRWFSLTTECPS